jgi:hypothetical protein
MSAMPQVPYDLGPMPTDRSMTTIDELLVRAPLPVIFALAARVERWPEHLAHYRSVRFLERRDDGGGLVEMSANRPFGAANWPTWWTSLMRIVPSIPDVGDAGRRERRDGAIRFRHVRGVTTGMDVEWQFQPRDDATVVRIVHAWNGPAWPLIGGMIARVVIGPVFVHGIASRTLAGLARVAERITIDSSHSEVSGG